MYRDVISDICQKMGLGMTEILVKKVDTMADWDQVSGDYINFAHSGFLL